MNITMTGASGFIGRRLLKRLLEGGHRLHVLSRNAGTNLPAGVRVSVWDSLKGAPPPEESLRDCDVVLHLAGEPVAQRWNEEVKRRIRDSRVAATRHLVEAMAKLVKPPGALICASATGFYGSRGGEILDESAEPGSGFLAEVCVEWEREASAAKALGTRVAMVRTGIALDPSGGALQKMLPPFQFGLGGTLGDGKQWTPWVHLQDLLALYEFAVNHPLEGPFNAVAPQPVTNAEFTSELAKALHRPALFTIPKFALKALYGEMAETLFGSQRVVPKRAEAAEFRFRFPSIQLALADLFNR